VGGYSFEVPALEMPQGKQINMNSIVSCNLQNGQRDARDFDWTFFPILIFLIQSSPFRLPKLLAGLL
jgi:hypothetical protein